jgi:hypothetical protein
MATHKATRNKGEFGQNSNAEAMLLWFLHNFSQASSQGVRVSSGRAIAHTSGTLSLPPTYVQCQELKLTEYILRIVIALLRFGDGVLEVRQSVPV